jgi:hypothetical protein
MPIRGYTFLPLTSLSIVYSTLSLHNITVLDDTNTADSKETRASNSINISAGFLIEWHVKTRDNRVV